MENTFLPILIGVAIGHYLSKYFYSALVKPEYSPNKVFAVITFAWAVLVSALVAATYFTFDAKIVGKAQDILLVVIMFLPLMEGFQAYTRKMQTCHVCNTEFDQVEVQCSECGVLLNESSTDSKFLSIEVIFPLLMGIGVYVFTIWLVAN